MPQGKPFTPAQVNRIIQLLRETDMTLDEIAERMSCTPNAVGQINKRHKVRNYVGKTKYNLLPEA